MGFEDGYSAEIIDFFSVRDIDKIGLAGERVVFVYDFREIPENKLDEYLKMRQGMKVIFFEKPYEDLSADTLAEKLDIYNIEVGFLELNASSELIRQAILKRVSENQEKLFRVHTIKPAEIEKLNLDYEMVLRRWVRAWKERSIDFFWIQPLPSSMNKSYNEYGFDVVSMLQTTRNIEIHKPFSLSYLIALIIVGCFLLILFYSPLMAGISVIFLVIVFLTQGYYEFILYLSGLTGTFGITAIYRELRGIQYSGALKYFSIIAFAFVLGILLNALTFNFLTVSQLLLPRGVKLLLFYLPALVFLREFAYYGAKEMKSKLHWTDLLIIIFFVLFVIYYIMRSGNSALVLNFERKFRDWLEIVFGIRPRLKEIIGLPALWLYFNNKHRAFGRYSFLVPVVGVMGLCSIVNSFQHIHTPFLTVILREVIGSGIGIGLGVLIGFFIQPYKSQEYEEKI